MKKITINVACILFCMVMSFHSYAVKVSHASDCTKLGYAAEIVMEARQENARFRDIYTDQTKAMHPLILKAWNYPVFEDDGSKEIAIDYFVDKVLAACHKKLLEE